MRANQQVGKPARRARPRIDARPCRSSPPSTGFHSGRAKAASMPIAPKQQAQQVPKRKPWSDCYNPRVQTTEPPDCAPPRDKLSQIHGTLARSGV